MEKDFIIDQASWHTQVVRNYELNKSGIYSYFKSIISYLQNNKLTVRTILIDNEPATDDTCIRVSDLTEEGFELMKKAYDKWLEEVDKGKKVDNYKLLDKALASIRTK